MRYRFSIGKDQITSILTEDFIAAGAWVYNGGWAHNAGGQSADHAGATWDYLELANQYELPNEYKITFKFINSSIGGTDVFRVYIGDYSIEAYEFVPDAQEHTITGRAMSGTTARFVGFGTVRIDYINIDRLDWNTALTNVAVNFWDTSLRRTFSERLDFSYVGANDDITFEGAAYDYIKGRFDGLLDDDFDSTCIVPILIERQKYIDEDWERHFEASFIISECVFDLKKKTVDVTVSDDLATKVIRGAGEKRVEITWDNKGTYSVVNIFEDMVWGHNGNSYGSGIPSIWTLFRNGAGAYVLQRSVYSLYRMLRQIVHEISGLTVTLESDLLTTGTYQFFGVTRGVNLINNTVRRSMYQSYISQLEDANTIFAFGSYLFYDFDGVPTIKLEDQSSLLGAVQSFTVDNTIARFTFLGDLPQNVEIGYEPEEDAVGTSQFTANNYASIEDCSTESLELVSEFYASDGEINARVTGGVTNIVSEDNIYVEVQFDDPVHGIIGFTAGAPGVNLYNDTIDTNDNMTRWVDILQSNFIDGENNRTATKTNDPVVREWESFDYPINTTQLEAILDAPFSLIPFTPYKDTTAINGQILSVGYNNKTERTSFELKSE